MLWVRDERNPVSNLSMFREAVLAVNDQLKAGTPSNEVSYPKCKQIRCVVLEPGESKWAACNMCGQTWLVQ